ncbi:arabinogalactan oligomer/maltooligosaccharide transport system permease protein [Paenibacillus forsythiae]|uniref:Arabinogalactan oligomer/maltooligosaccharide transport system permease protein n=1 Tax=Paenibacillus forsythiae TaxID=365616 RepID=A0ABU3H4A2_9BACL|nr:sugar ABC transporter permease [Paenibacillus forsythiae]MDT3425556.1 arabinogalactan oligomer/maltooligosaccharide transport system permease protein [Paenibacillus forsythiae]
MKPGNKARTTIRLSFSYIALILLTAFCAYPALWVLMSSVRTGDALFSDTILPTAYTFSHYTELFAKHPFGVWYMNTLKIAVSSMILGTILTLLTGYTFSVFRFTGRKNLMSLLLVLGLFPGFMSMIAIYILLNQMNLLNTHTAVIIVYAAGAPLYFLFAKSYFDTIPRSLVEAARIDGAGHMPIFFRIVLPLSTPLIVYTALMTFTGAFTDFIFAKLVLRSPDKKTLAVGLFDMIGDRFSNEFTMFAAGCVLAAVPVTILFILMQRFLVEGLTAGADKG